MLRNNRLMSVLEYKPILLAVLNTLFVLVGLIVRLEIGGVSCIFNPVKNFIYRLLSPTGRIFESARSASAFGLSVCCGYWNIFRAKLTCNLSRSQSFNAHLENPSDHLCGFIVNLPNIFIGF